MQQSPSEFKKNEFPSICEIAKLDVKYEVVGSYIEDLSITFNSCNGEWWQFKSKQKIANNGLSVIQKKVYNSFKKMYGFKKPPFDKNYRIKLPINETNWTLESLKSYWKENGVDHIEGIYEGSSEEHMNAIYKIGIIQDNEEYLIIYLEGIKNHEDWIEGEIKARMKKTANPAMFKLEWYKENKSINNEPYAALEPGLIHVFWSGLEKGLFLKLFPSEEEQIEMSANKKTSGTGFALSPEGYIVTSQHVVHGAPKIKVRGVQGDFSNTYNAIIIIEDKNNDLAIIKIDDPSFSTFGDIPYSFESQVADVGSSVYSLGYPLRATMGDEVKLTNGIISSKTGFQGDITTYQISVPLQPGNSGGPLFDSKGNVIGIVNAKHIAAENASYAVKSSYLLNMIQVMDPIPILNQLNIISEAELAQQVKLIKEHVFMIEVN